MTIEFSTTTTSSFSGNEIEGSFTRGVEFTQSVTVSVPSTETEDFTITNISVVLIGEQDSITITIDEPTIDFEGTYLSGWDDVFTYVPPGESDKTTTPINATIDELPDGQDLYNLNQDQKQFIARNYDVTVTYIGSVSQEETTETETLTHEVFNDLESIRAFMSNYDYGEG
jgi:hypothetical protein